MVQVKTVNYDHKRREELNAIRLELRAKDAGIARANDYCKKCNRTGIVAGVGFKTEGREAVCYLIEPVELLPCICLTGWPNYFVGEHELRP